LLLSGFGLYKCQQWTEKLATEKIPSISRALCVDRMAHSDQGFAKLQNLLITGFEKFLYHLPQQLPR